MSPFQLNNVNVFYSLSCEVLEITSACCSGVKSRNFTAYPDTRIVKFDIFLDVLVHLIIIRL